MLLLYKLCKTLNFFMFDISCLRNRTTLRFDILHSFNACEQTYVFLVQGQPGDLSTKISFFSCLSLISACRLVLYLYACAVENPEILGFCVSKSRQDISCLYHFYCKKIYFFDNTVDTIPLFKCRCIFLADTKQLVADTTVYLLYKKIMYCEFL